MFFCLPLCVALNVTIRRLKMRTGWLVPKIVLDTDTRAFGGDGVIRALEAAKLEELARSFQTHHVLRVNVGECSGQVERVFVGLLSNLGQIK